jgi:hypothetical protein
MAGTIESSARSSDWRPRRASSESGPGSRGHAAAIEANRRLVEGLVSSVFGRERIADALRAVAEDALYPSRRDGSVHPGVATSEDALGRTIDDVAESTTTRLVERLAQSVEPVAPPARSDRHLAYDPR